MTEDQLEELRKRKGIGESDSSYIRRMLFESMGVEPRKAEDSASETGRTRRLVPSAEMPTAPKPKSDRPHMWEYGHPKCSEVDLAHKGHTECCTCKARKK